MHLRFGFLQMNSKGKINLLLSLFFRHIGRQKIDPTTKKETSMQGSSLTEIYLGNDAFLEMILFNCVIV